MVRALWNGAVIAEAPRTVMVEGNHYFPPEAVNRDYLTDSDTTSVCGWKGTARYLTLQVDGATNPDAAWYYPEPLPEAAHITGHIAFWRGVVVEGRPENA
ncbi:DUF427 domain-containing protein [Streptomyces specialis]|uniref:DUF427 domain-containing protein n=1 Tax=Streptomyces specialis TaxID=498367 RepID=UPI00073E56C4|nr:DUF427 domain-containing protein [Streptomyces specialis]